MSGFLNGLGGRYRDIGKGRAAARRTGRAATRRVRGVPTPAAEGTTVNRGFHLRALARAWRQFHEGSLSHWTTTTVIALSLTIYGAFALLMANANTALEQWKGDSLITVFMEGSASMNQVAAVRDTIAGQNGVASLRVVSPVEAMGRLKTMLGGEAGLLDNLDENPLPTSIEFRLASGGGAHDENLAQAEKLAHTLGGWPGVEAVSYDYQWARRLGKVVRMVRYTGLVLSFLLLSAVALIISNTIKLTIIARRDEVEVMRFMGATDAFIKTPFIYEGILQGLLGAVGALILTILLYLGAREATLELGHAFGVLLQLHYLPISQWLVILGLGVALGLAGALLSLSRFLEV